MEHRKRRDSSFGEWNHRHSSFCVVGVAVNLLRRSPSRCLVLGHHVGRHVVYGQCLRFASSNQSDTYNDGHWLAVGPVRYITGKLIAFSGVEACESYVASLVSKVVTSSLAVGTFKSGLMATLVGTVRRYVLLLY